MKAEYEKAMKEIICDRCDDRYQHRTCYPCEGTTEKFLALIESEKCKAVEGFAGKVQRIMFEQAFYNPDAYIAVRDMKLRIDQYLNENKAVDNDKGSDI